MFSSTAAQAIVIKGFKHNFAAWRLKQIVESEIGKAPSSIKVASFDVIGRARIVKVTCENREMGRDLLAFWREHDFEYRVDQEVVKLRAAWDRDQVCRDFSFALGQFFQEFSDIVRAAKPNAKLATRFGSGSAILKVYESNKVARTSLTLSLCQPS